MRTCVARLLVDERRAHQAQQARVAVAGAQAVAQGHLRRAEQTHLRHMLYRQTSLSHRDVACDCACAHLEVAVGGETHAVAGRTEVLRHGRDEAHAAAVTRRAPHLSGQKLF